MDPSNERAEFEQTLDAALEVEKKPRRWSWEWLNKPITLWALSTIAVGLISSFIAQSSKCYDSLDADVTRSLKLQTELVYRIGLIAGAGRLKTDTPYRREITAEALDPERGFVLSEFKGKTASELATELRLLYRKWNVDAYDLWIGVRNGEMSSRMNAFLEDVLAGGSGGAGRDVVALTERYLDIVEIPGRRLQEKGSALSGAFRALDLVEIGPLIQRFAKMDSVESFESIWTWGNHLDRASGGVANIRIAPASVCTKAALWPFRGQVF